MKKDFVFTSESVTEGHPDKLCDQVSDAIIDHFLDLDPYARVRAECAVATSILFIAARFASEVKGTWPTSPAKPSAGNRLPGARLRRSYLQHPHQSPGISPDADIYFNEHKLSDQEIDKIHVRQHANVFGFACNHTPSLMPLPIRQAHRWPSRSTRFAKKN
jgi:S-adenosylmethionine synthetase